jgi:effector-binding domain-containing protein
VSGFAVLEYGARPTAVVRATVTAADLPGLFARALQAVLVAMEAQGTLPAGEPFAYYHSHPDGPVDVEVGFPILGTFVAAGEVVPGDLPGGRVVTGLHVGPYEELARTLTELRGWATSLGFKATRDLWQVYLTDPEREPDPERWRTQLFLRVE